jgi:hypothetical protein
MNKLSLSCVLCALLFSAAAIQAQTGSIKGSIFADADGDAKPSQGEESSDGQKVKLYRIDEKGNRVLVAEVVTNADGAYEFGSLEFGTYVLMFDFESGVSVETAAVITLTPQSPTYVQQPIPYLGTNYREVYGDLRASTPLPGSPVGSGTLDALGLRNPANMNLPEASDFTI